MFIEVGDYSYPFQVILPHNLPTSFEGLHGQVRYSINAKIDIPWAFNKVIYSNKFKKIFHHD